MAVYESNYGTPVVPGVPMSSSRGNNPNQYFTEVKMPEEPVFFERYKKAGQGGVRLELLNASFGIKMLVFRFQMLERINGTLREKDRSEFYLSWDHSLELCERFQTGQWGTPQNGVLWKSEPMGTPAETLQARAARKGDPSISRGGNAEFRILAIRQGDRVPYLFSGTKCDGYENQYKLFQPVVKNGEFQNAVKIAIPLTFEDGVAIARMIKSHINGYISSQYALLALRPYIAQIMEMLAELNAGKVSSPEAHKQVAFNAVPQNQMTPVQQVYPAQAPAQQVIQAQYPAQAPAQQMMQAQYPAQAQPSMQTQQPNTAPAYYDEPISDPESYETTGDSGFGLGPDDLPF